MATITIGGRVLEVRPLNLKTLRVVLPRLDELRSGSLDVAAQVDAILDMAMPALARCNEGVTREWLEEEISVDQIPEILRVLGTASGLTQVAPGEAPSP